MTVALVGGALLALSPSPRYSSRGADPARAPGCAAVGSSRLVRLLAVGGRIADRPRAVAVAVALTIVAWLLDASLIWCVAQSLGIDCPSAAR